MTSTSPLFSFSSKFTMLKSLRKKVATFPLPVPTAQSVKPMRLISSSTCRFAVLGECMLM